MTFRARHMSDHRLHENGFVRRIGDHRIRLVIRGRRQRVLHHRVSQVDVRGSGRIHQVEVVSKSVSVLRHRAFGCSLRRSEVGVTTDFLAFYGNTDIFPSVPITNQYGIRSIRRPHRARATPQGIPLRMNRR